MPQVIHTDVLVIGAGPAGVSTSLFLAKKGIPSVLIDKARFPRDKICGDALSGKVVEVLNKLDKSLVPEMNQQDSFLGSWGVTFVAPGGNALRMPFRTKNATSVPPGFISTRLNFDDWMVSKVRNNQLIEFQEETTIRKYTRENDLFIAEATNGNTYHAPLLVICDGAYSTFSKNVAGLVTEATHNCFGLRAYYKNVSGMDADNFIELHFLKELLPGYFWIFPLPGGLANVGVGMRADKMAAKNINLKRAFSEILENNPVMKQRFAGAEKIGDVKLFGLPLGSKRRKISGEGYLLCGDAAQLIDPFTGEGIGNAMTSGMYAAAQVERCISHKNYSADFMRQYDDEVYLRLGDELALSSRMQQLVNYPWLFDLVVRKANSNYLLRDTISCMFEDIDMRSRLRNPLFYLKLLFS